MKTIRSFILALTYILLAGNAADAQSWLWGIANTSSFIGVVEAAPTTVDVNGYSFAAGSIFLADSITIGSYTLTDLGGHEEILIVRADPSGNVTWVVNSLNYFSQLNCMITDPNGNLYVMGQYYDSSFQMGTATLLNDTDNYAMQFLLKLSPAGNVVWARNLAGGAQYHTGGIGLDQNGYVYVAGCFGTSTATIGADLLVNSSPAGDTTDIYIAKFDILGNPIWAKSFGGHGSEHPTGLSASSDGSLYLTGLFTSQNMTIGSDLLTDSMFYVSGTSPFQFPFFAKFDSSGNPVWAKDLSRHIHVNDFTTDNTENVYLAGGIDSAIILGTDTLSLMGTLTALVAKYDSTGTAVWANTAGGHFYTRGYAIGIDTCDNVWMAGSTDGITNFNGYLVDTPAAGTDKMFIAAWDHCGKYIVGTGVELGSGGDDGMGMALDKHGNIFIGGDYENIPLVLGPDTLPVPPAAKEYFFLAKYNYGTVACNRAACCTISPTASFIDTNFNPSVSFYYTGSTAYDSIRWDFGDGTTSTAPNPTHIYANGIYHACLYVYSGCGVDSICTDIIVAETGTGNLAHNDEIITYPNPATNEYVIQSQTGFPAGATATVYDLAGKLVRSYSLSGHKTTLDVEVLASGTYQCRIITGKNVIVKKLVVMR